MDNTRCLAVAIYLFSSLLRDVCQALLLTCSMLQYVHINKKIKAIVINDSFIKLYYYPKTSTARCVGKLFHLVHSLQSYTCKTKQLFLFSFLRYIFHRSLSFIKFNVTIIFIKLYHRSYYCMCVSFFEVIASLFHALLLL